MNEPTKDDYDRAIAEGFGDLVTVEGFTIRETRDLLWGNPEVTPQNFDGLRKRVMARNPIFDDIPFVECAPSVTWNWDRYRK